MTALAWDQAREIAYRAAGPLPPAPVPLVEAVGSVLADPVVALCSLPPFDAAAMDGYAVRGDQPWTLVGQVRAGDTAPAPLSQRQACAVTTGAVVPPGTEAVVPVEHSAQDGSRITGRAGHHVRRAGEECAAGDEVLPAGTVVSAVAAGLAAALGHDVLHVHPRPRVSALVTGDELLRTGLPRAGMIRDAIGPALPGLIAASGGRLTATTPVPDDRAALTRAIDEADTELVLVSGSSAAGTADHLHPSLAALGARVLVPGVACRPGRPQSLARLPGGRLVVGLPGNPLAALVGFLTLAVPACAALRGAGLDPLAQLAAPDVPPHRADTRLVPSRIRDGKAYPMPHAGSAMLRGAALADAFAVVAPVGSDVPDRALEIPS